MLRMWGDDYRGANYRPSEWRHAIQLRGAVNICIEGLRIDRSGGDGIYVGAGPDREPCRDIVVRDVVCDAHHRQGISVISVAGLRLERVVLQGTRGTPPQAGLDVEPNHPWEHVSNVRIIDCTAADNHGAGFTFYFGNLDATSTPVSIQMERCRAFRNRGPAFSWTGARRNGPIQGHVVVRDCEFESDAASPVRLAHVAAGATSFLFRRVRIECAATGRPPVTIKARQDAVVPLGGIHMQDVEVRTPDPETLPIQISAHAMIPRLAQLEGTLTVVDPTGHRRTEPFTVEQLRRWQPELLLADLAPMDLDPAASPPPGEAVPVRLRLRHWANVLLWPGEDGVGEVAVETGRRDTQTNVRIRALDRDGRTVLSTNLSSGARAVWRLGPGGYPPWRWELQGEGAVLVFSTQRGRVRLCASSAVHLHGWQGAFELRVPPRSDQWALSVAASPPGEGVRVELSDTAGRVIATADDVVERVILHGQPVEDGVVRLRFSRPATKILEDYSILLFGCAPWLDPIPAPRP